jgi:hypothetical protein
MGVFRAKNEPEENGFVIELGALDPMEVNTPPTIHR